MSGASDKARFYLEQAVPQLREFEEKKIFNKVCAPQSLERLRITDHGICAGRDQESSQEEIRF
jgi:hypothetical protein